MNAHSRRLARIGTGLLLGIGVAALAVGGAVAAGTAKGTAWTRISGPQKAGAELGLHRGSDGKLDVAWAEGAPATIHETQISATGSKLGTSTITSGFDGLGGLALAGMGDGSVRLFAAGGHVVGLGSSQSGINNYVRGSGGWSLDQSSLWGGAVASAAGFVTATMTKDGQPVTSWDGAIHVGLGTSAPSSAYQPDMTRSDVVTDGATGAVVLGGITIAGKGGTFVQQVLPSTGSSVILPSTLHPNAAGLAARTGAPGVYIAYATNSSIALARYGGPTRTIAHGAFSLASAFTGPEGRLWLAWWGSSSGILATRSNKAVSAFEPVQKIGLPKNALGTYLLQGEGSAGPLDLFADIQASTTDRGFWQTHVLARANLSASVAKPKGKGKPETVTFSLKDAGDPLAGAIIVVAVGGHTQQLKTDASGHASVSYRGKPAVASAHTTLPGYAPAATSVHVG